MGSENQIDILTQINLDDMIASFGWRHWNTGRLMGRILFKNQARKFARQVTDLDECIRQSGLQEGSRQILPQFMHGLKAEGQAGIPTSGSLLIVSNHPGMYDTLALFASIPRIDLQVVGNERPFLTALPVISSRMIYVPDDTENRLAVIRQVTRTLRSGRAVLTFPAGHIEPDPAVLPGAIESLDEWSDSIGIFARAAPDLTLVGAIVSHVLSPQATYHPLTRLRRQKKDRESLGATLQLIANTLFPGLWKVVPEVIYTPPLAAASLAGLRDPRAITEAVKAYMRPYILTAKHI